MTDYRVYVIGADGYFIKAVYLDFADAEAAIESTKFKPSSGATVVRSLSPKTAVTMLKNEGGGSLIASRSAMSRRETSRRCSDYVQFLADTVEKIDICATPKISRRSVLSYLRRCKPL
jgi:hypothetical protein